MARGRRRHRHHCRGRHAYGGPGEYGPGDAAHVRAVCPQHPGRRSRRRRPAARPGPPGRPQGTGKRERERKGSGTSALMALIHHLVPAAEWAAVPPDQPYLPAAYAADGFIHCTTLPAVLLEVANRFYQGAAGAFLVLDIDPDQLAAELRYEAPMPAAPAGSP